MTPSKLGILIDKLHNLREEKRKLNNQEKEINVEYEDLEREVIKMMQDQGLPRADGNNASASYKVERYPQVKDKEVFYKWVVTNNKFEFVQSRINAAPFREMLDLQNLIPEGIEVHQKEKLNLRSKPQ